MAVFGLAPKPTLGGLGFASARSDAWSLGLEARADLPITDEQKSVRFRTSSYSLGAVPCVHLGFAFACELTTFGWVDATGFGGAAKSGTSLLFSVGARLGAELALSTRFGVVAHADVLVSPWPVRVVTQGQTLWETQTSGDLGLAVAFHFQ